MRVDVVVSVAVLLVSRMQGHSIGLDIWSQALVFADTFAMCSDFTT